MRQVSLSVLLIAAVLAAAPASAQEELQPPLISPAAPDPISTQPLIVVGEDTETPAPTIDPIPRVWAPAPQDDQGRSAYGLFLSARSALAQGELEAGARYLSAVQGLTPEQPTIQDQAATAALLAGDLAFAARIAPDGASASPVITQAAELVSAVQAFADGDARRVNARLKADPIGAPHARAGALIAPWIAAAAGDWTTALAEPNPTADPLTLLFGRYNRALLLERRGRDEEAGTALKALVDNPRTAPFFRLPYGEFLERQGRRDEALALYDAALAAGAAEPGLAVARARAADGGRPPRLPEFQAGAADALTISARQASTEGAKEFAVVYLRLALNLDRQPASLYLLGQTLAEANMDGPAQAILTEVPDTEPAVYAAARVQLGLSLAKEERPEEALAALQDAVRATPADPRIAFVTAGQLVQMERYDEALALLNGPLLNTAEQGGEVRFMRGAAYESLGRIPEAEGELWAALQTSPDEPVFLNYLGYLWVDSGTRVAEGAAMIARAHAADPEDGNIQDSLGWAQFRQGQYEIAVDTLEQAVAKEPANPEINDHLGDAYWSVGRRREAGFQWNRVLTLDPDAERRAEVERKIVQGLDL